MCNIFLPFDDDDDDDDDDDYDTRPDMWETTT
jgi:hypothetical protein